MVGGVHLLSLPVTNHYTGTDTCGSCCDSDLLSHFLGSHGTNQDVLFSTPGKDVAISDRIKHHSRLLQVASTPHSSDLIVSLVKYECRSG